MSSNKKVLHPKKDLRRVSERLQGNAAETSGTPIQQQRQAHSKKSAGITQNNFKSVNSTKKTILRNPRQEQQNDSTSKQNGQIEPRIIRKRENEEYEEYLTQEVCLQLLEKGVLIKGRLRINQKNYKEAYVSDPQGGADILIDGVFRRNRALERDVVAVQLLPESTWKKISKSNQKLPEQNRPATSVSDNASDSSQHPNAVIKKLDNLTIADEKDDGVTKETLASASSSAGSGQVQFKSYTQKLGKVVRILQVNHKRVAVGHVQLMKDQSQQNALFIPNDYRVPHLIVPMRECPKNFYQRPQDYKTMLFVAELTDWPKKSKFPMGKLINSIGQAGLVEPETTAILTSHGINTLDFTKQVLECLPKNSAGAGSSWSIPEEEIGRRTDYRQDCVFTIDPATARDLDDAVSCEQIGEDLYRVCVHIADVSYFIPEGTELDMEAKDRATTVYMVQRAIPMLPRMLCEDLCSLHPGVDRLTTTVEWTMSGEGDVRSTRFTKGIINSCCKMNYDEAQDIIDHPDKAWSTEELSPVHGKHSIQDIVTAILNLDKMARVMRRRRFESGALRLDNIKLCFTLNADTGYPAAYAQQVYVESKKLIEELMLLANMAAAELTYKAYPHLAVLRRHDPPAEKMMNDASEECALLGIHLDLTNAHEIQQTLQKYLIRQDVQSKATAALLVNLLSKPMKLAEYFCTGSLSDDTLYHHYALNVPLYTHFTSPIRRYPDILVHRLIAAYLGHGVVTERSTEELANITDHCNAMKYSAKVCSDASCELFFTLFVKECGPLTDQAIVIAVLDHSFDVMLLTSGITKRIYKNNLEVISWRYCERQKATAYIDLQWPRQPSHMMATLDETLMDGDVKVVNDIKASDGKVVEDVKAGDVKVVNDVKDGDGNVVDDAKDGDGNVVDDVKDGDGNVVDDVKGGDSKVVNDVKGGDVKVVDDVKGGDVKVVDDVKGGDVKVADDVKGGDVKVVDDVKGGGSKVVDDVKGDDGKVVDDVKGDDGKVVDDVKGGDGKVVDDVKGGGSKVVDDVKGCDGKVVDDVKGGDGKVVDDVKGGDGKVVAQRIGVMDVVRVQIFTKPDSIKLSAVLCHPLSVSTDVNH